MRLTRGARTHILEGIRHAERPETAHHGDPRCGLYVFEDERSGSGLPEQLRATKSGCALQQLDEGGKRNSCGKHAARFAEGTNLVALSPVGQDRSRKQVLAANRWLTQRCTGRQTVRRRSQNDRLGETCRRREFLEFGHAFSWGGDKEPAVGPGLEVYQAQASGAIRSGKPRYDRGSGIVGGGAGWLDPVRRFAEF
jgi:hypothetical protein